MGLILDSTALIAAERAGQNAYQMVAGVGGSGTVLALSAISIMELAHGVVRANSEPRRVARQRFLNELLVAIPVHPVTSPIALRAGQIDGQLRMQRTVIPMADLLIGATALELGYAVATHNLRHFRMIPDLVVKAL